KINRSLDAMRFVDRHDHFQRSAAVVHAAERLAIFFDGVDQILDDPHVARVQSPGFHCLFLARAVTGDFLPGFLALSRCPRRIINPPHRWETARPELNDALGAVDPQAESTVFPAPGLARAKGADHTALEPEARVNLIAENRSHSLSAGANVRLCR